MITFKQYLNEAEPQDFGDFIVEHCHHLLSELDIDLDDLDDLPLYRGMTGAGSQSIVLDIDGKPVKCYIKSVRQNRAPLDTHPDLSDVIDDCFQEKFGWKPRSQSVFCYGKHGKELTEDYGDLHRVYPMGDFKFVWGEVKDLTHKIRDLMKQYRFPYKGADEPYDGEQQADFYEIFSDNLEGKYHDTDLWAAITGAPREIMIGCKQYLAVPVK